MRGVKVVSEKLKMKGRESVCVLINSIFYGIFVGNLNTRKGVIENHSVGFSCLNLRSPIGRNARIICDFYEFFTRSCNVS